MSLVNKLIAKLFSKKIGQDEFGNEYRVGYVKSYLGHNKRFVIYNGIDLSSKVPPVWHSWLHYLIDEIPVNSTKKMRWEKDYRPNLTGTKHAYDPSKLSDRSPVYNRWET